jgi:hypothetical protein
MSERCKHCGGVDNWHHDLTECVDRLKGELAEAKRGLAAWKGLAEQLAIRVMDGIGNEKPAYRRIQAKLRADQPDATEIQAVPEPECSHDFGSIFCWKCGADKPETLGRGTRMGKVRVPVSVDHVRPSRHSQRMSEPLDSESNEPRDTIPSPPIDDGCCYCSDRMSGGLPCRPYQCPNRPAMAPMDGFNGDGGF